MNSGIFVTSRCHNITKGEKKKPSCSLLSCKKQGKPTYKQLNRKINPKIIGRLSNLTEFPDKSRRVAFAKCQGGTGRASHDRARGTGTAGGDTGGDGDNTGQQTPCQGWAPNRKGLGCHSPQGTVTPQIPLSWSAAH